MLQLQGPADYVGQIAVGIDIGTSTCQAWVSLNRQREAVWIEGANAQHRYFPSLVLERQDGTRLFGFAASAEASMRDHPSIVHRNFKAYLKSDCPLKPRYSVDQALRLFKDIALDYSLRVLPVIEERANAWAGRVRVDLTYTVPAGWRIDPTLEEKYRSVLREIARILDAKYPGKLGVHPRLLEEPVAAFLAATLNNAAQPSQEGPALMIDAGGGTLDVTACSRRMSGGRAVYDIEFARSVGVAGEAFFEAFLSALVGVRASSPALPADTNFDHALRTGLEELFHTYCTGNADALRKVIHGDGGSRYELTFSRSAVNKLIAGSRQAQQVTKFLGDLLTEYGKRTGKPILSWSEVYVAGGLGQYPPFLELVRQIYPRARVVSNPQDAIAKGAALDAEQAGTLIGERACENHLAERLLERGTEKHIWSILIQKGTRIAASTSKPWTGLSYKLGDGSAFQHTLGWVLGERDKDLLFKINDASVEMPVAMKDEDELRTEIRFDDLLDIELTVVHVKSGHRWTRNGIRSGV